MKSCLLLGCLFINCVLSFAQNNPQFDIQSATITYVHSGSSYGTSLLYFNDFGNKKANQTIIRSDSANGRILSQYNEIFINNKRIENSSGTKTNKITTGVSLSNSMITTVFTRDMLNKLDFFENGKCNIARKTCIKYCSKTDTICLWNGIVLKATMQLSIVSIHIEATQVELNPPPESVFQYVTENINTK